MTSDHVAGSEFTVTPTVADQPPPPIGVAGLYDLFIDSTRAIVAE